MGLISLPYLLAMIGCNLFSVGCDVASQPWAPPASDPSAYHVMVDMHASSPTTTVAASANGTTTTNTIYAPYGVATRVVSQTVNGKTTSYATTTPLTPADIDAMNAQLDHMETTFEQRLETMRQHQRELMDRMQQLANDFEISL